jgi:hypothetical protein
MTNDLEFFITTLPDSRPADYYLGCLGGSVFMDFENCDGERIRLIRISFDGYGCCDLGKDAIPMNKADSQAFLEIIESLLSDQMMLATIVKKTISSNKDLIWEDALNEYGLSL